MLAPLIHIHSEKQIITQIAVVLSNPGEEAAAAMNGNTGPKAGEDAGSLWRVGYGDVILGAEEPARSKLLTRNHENVDFGKDRGDTRQAGTAHFRLRRSRSTGPPPAGGDCVLRRWSDGAHKFFIPNPFSFSPLLIRVQKQSALQRAHSTKPRPFADRST